MSTRTTRKPRLGSKKPITHLAGNLRAILAASAIAIIIVLGVSGYQTRQAEKQAQQARVNMLKGEYALAASQLNSITAILVWPITLHKIAATKSQNKQFEGYAASLTQINQLIDDAKLEEASSALAKIDKTFPEYAKVQALEKAVSEQKADSLPLPGPVQIVGDASCQTSAQAALNLLKAKAPTHYAIVQGYIGIIECVPEGSRTFAAQKPPKFFAADATRNAGTTWYAAVLAHEAGHSKLYRDYKAAHPGQIVPDSIWTGEAAEKVCLDAQYDALTKLGATMFELDAVRNALKTQYYNVSRTEQWW